MTKVFLGGTCNESTWRNQMIVYLQDIGLEYFNPVVNNWDDNAQANELREREECDFCLYVITPKMMGTYSVAEVVDDSNKRPEKTVMVLLRDDGDNKFTEGQWKSLNAMAKMVKNNGGQVFDSLHLAATKMGTEDLQQRKSSELNDLLQAFNITDKWKIENIKNVAMNRHNVKRSRREHVKRILDEAFMLLKERNTKNDF